MTVTDSDLVIRFRQHRHRRDRYRARIIRQLRGLGYQVRTWKEAERVARRLTQKH